MRTKVHAGPEPMRLYLSMIDADAFAYDVRELILRAQRGRGHPVLSPRRLIEAVQVAHDAARARERIARQQPVPCRWLAALGNVATSRVRNLIREGVLVRADGGVEAYSAARWIKRVRPRRDHRRLFQVEPSWWARCRDRALAYCSGLSDIIRSAVPKEFELDLDETGTPCFVVPADLPIELAEIEEIRARVRQVLEPFENPSTWPAPIVAVDYGLIGESNEEAPDSGNEARS